MAPAALYSISHGVVVGGGRAVAEPAVGACPAGVRHSLPPVPRQQMGWRRRRAQVAAKAQKENNETDFVNNLVGMIFGKKVLEDPEPAGLKRMTKEDWPDQWPAVVDEFAAPVDGDDGDAALLRPLLRQTQLEFSPLGLAFDADVHGWSTERFHKQLDGMGAALVIARTEDGAVLGGYNPKGWLGYGDWRDAISAFLFTWPDGNVEAPALKLPKTGGSGMAIIDEPNAGPKFGPEGLEIDIEKRTARSRLGTYYERRSDGGRSLFASGSGDGGRKQSAAAVISLKVFVGLTETAKQASYVPNSLQWQPGQLEKIRADD